LEWDFINVHIFLGLEKCAMRGAIGQKGVKSIGNLLDEFHA
jgi:hypothetical protein